MNPRIHLTLCQNLSKIGPEVFEILRFENWVLGPMLSLLWSATQKGATKILYKELGHSHPQVFTIRMCREHRR